jgi:hypothetical protein
MSDNGHLPGAFLVTVWLPSPSRVTSCYTSGLEQADERNHARAAAQLQKAIDAKVRQVLADEKRAWAASDHIGNWLERARRLEFQSGAERITGSEAKQSATVAVAQLICVFVGHQKIFIECRPFVPWRG